MSAELSDPEGSWAGSLALWGGLAVAGMLFALATLAPRLADLEALRNRYAESQTRLVRLEEQTHDLERLCEALRTDPQFATELAKLEFSGTPQDAERIAVGPELQLGEELVASHAVTIRPAGATAELARSSFVWLSAHPRLRAAMLALAAVIGLVSLVGVDRKRLPRTHRVTMSLRNALERFAARYRCASPGE